MGGVGKGLTRGVTARFFSGFGWSTAKQFALASFAFFGMTFSSGCLVRLGVGKAFEYQCAGMKMASMNDGGVKRVRAIAALAIAMLMASQTHADGYPSIGYRDHRYTGTHCVPIGDISPNPELYLLKISNQDFSKQRQFETDVAEFFSGKRYRARLKTETDYRVTMTVGDKRLALDCVPRWGLGSLDKTHPLDTNGDYIVLERIGTEGKFGDFPLENRCDAGVSGWVDCDVGTRGLSRRSASGAIQWARLIAIAVPYKEGHPLYVLPRAFNIIDQFSEGSLLNDGTAVLTYWGYMSIRIDLKTGLPIEPRPNIASVPLEDWAQLKRVLNERWTGNARPLCQLKDKKCRKGLTPMYFYGLQNYLFPSY